MSKKEKIKCSRCSGSGSILCPACQGTREKRTKIVLKEETRTKIVTCSLCKGRRKIKCGVCGGSGSK